MPSLYTLYSQGNKAWSEWLYGPWTKEKYDTYKVLNSIPGVHEYFDYLLDKRADSEYFRRYGLDYTDIHDPRALSQSSSSRAMMQSVSRNVGTLYRSVSKPVKKSKRGSRSRSRR